MKKCWLGCLLLAMTAVYSFGESWPCGSCGLNWFNITDWYWSTGGSADWHRRMKLEGADTREQFKFDPGWNAFGALGVVIGCNWRAELEVAYMRSGLKNVDSFVGGSSAVVNVNGHVEDVPLMLNAYYDIPLLEFVGWYVGAGMGICFNRIVIDPYSQGATSFLGSTTKDNLFAWQLKTGLMVYVNCHITVFAGYRLFGTSKPDSSATRLAGSSAGYKDRPYLNSLEAGIRVKI